MYRWLENLYVSDMDVLSKSVRNFLFVLRVKNVKKMLGLYLKILKVKRNFYKRILYSYYFYYYHHYHYHYPLLRGIEAFRGKCHKITAFRGVRLVLALTLRMILLPLFSGNPSKETTNSHIQEARTPYLMRPVCRRENLFDKYVTLMKFT
jgi:hypothetical protein